MQQYLELMRTVLESGHPKQDRTGTGTRSLFGYQMRFDLSQGFPLLTTKKLHLRSILIELLWFLRGDTNIQFLRDHRVTIWDEWADQDGNLGPVYGKQWRSWECPNGQTIDQILQVQQAIRETPDSRRLIVSAWNVADVEHMALPPCHLLVPVLRYQRAFELSVVSTQCRLVLGSPLQHCLLRVVDDDDGPCDQFGAWRIRTQFR